MIYPYSIQVVKTREVTIPFRGSEPLVVCQHFAGTVEANTPEEALGKAIVLSRKMLDMEEFKDFEKTPHVVIGDPNPIDPSGVIKLTNNEFHT